MNEKKSIFDEIKETIKFLLRERARGKEQFEVKDFFNAKLQENIINNFDKKITQEEYETVIMEMFGLKKISKDEHMTKEKLEDEIEKILLKYKIKSKSVIIRKIVENIGDANFDVKQVANIVENKYNEVIEEEIRRRLRSFSDRKLPAFNNFLANFKKENYEVSNNHIKSIYNKIVREKKQSQKTEIEDEDIEEQEKVDSEPLKYKTKSKPEEFNIKDYKKKKLIEQIKMRAKNKKERFINHYCKSFKFSYKGEEKDDNDKTVLIYQGSFQGRFVYIKVYKPAKKVENIILQTTYEMKRTRYSVVIDLNKFHKLQEMNAEKKYIQSRIKGFASIFGFGNFQEALWFLDEILHREHNVPKYIYDYLNDGFLNYLEDLDETLTNYAAYKALK